MSKKLTAQDIQKAAAQAAPLHIKSGVRAGSGNGRFKY
jgi:hypothetical protein